MRKRDWVICLTLILLILAIVAYFELKRISEVIRYRTDPSERYPQEREALATQLCTNPDKCSGMYAFPVPYYDQVLAPGMSVREVHSLMKGYQKVTSCSTLFPSETYFYYTTDPKKALLILLLYDKAQKFDSIQTNADFDSVNADGCQDGWLSDDALTTMTPDIATTP